MSKHPCKTVEYEGKQVEIDELLVELLQVAWHYGIRTAESCQGQYDDMEDAEYLSTTFLAFSSVSDMLTFAGAVIQGSVKDELHERIQRWDVAAFPIDATYLASYLGSEEDPPIGGSFLPRILLLTADVPKITQRLKTGCAEIAQYGPPANQDPDPCAVAGFARMFGRIPWV